MPLMACTIMHGRNVSAKLDELNLNIKTKVCTTIEEWTAHDDTPVLMPVLSTMFLESEVAPMQYISPTSLPYYLASIVVFPWPRRALR